MNPQTWTWIDKSSWGEGPWTREPDKVQWTDATTGLPCLAVRNEEQGHWCGYVGVPLGHPAYGRDYDEAADADVHGGLTFSDRCQPDTEHGICHQPGPGEPDDVWWLGFDCAHVFDLSPGMAARLEGFGLPRFSDEVYRPLTYVRAECRRLALALTVAPRE